MQRSFAVDEDSRLVYDFREALLRVERETTDCGACLELAWSLVACSSKATTFLRWTEADLGPLLRVEEADRTKLRDFAEWSPALAAPRGFKGRMGCKQRVDA